MAILASIRWETVFVQLGKRRIDESERGLGRLGIKQATGQQVHLGIPEVDFSARFDEVVERAAKIVVDNQVRRVIGFGPDGYDGHPGHKEANVALWAVADEVRRYGREIELHEVNSSHQGELRYAATDWSTAGQLDGMREHESQYHIDPRGHGSYEHEIMIGHHALRSDTWLMLAEGGVIDIVRNGVTFDIN